MLKSKIQADITEAMKAKNQEKVDTLRLLWSDLRNVEINTRKELTDEEVVSVIKKQTKKLAEASDMFEQGGRTDLVEENKKQTAILSEYLPPQMSDSELMEAIKSLMVKHKETFEKNPKALIGIAMKELSSQADGKKILETINGLIG